MNHSVIYLISELRPVFFPDALKILRISPTSKSGDQENISNYSPISLLRCFPKIPVQIMYDRLYNYLANEKIFNPRVFKLDTPQNMQLQTLPIKSINPLKLLYSRHLS